MTPQEFYDKWLKKEKSILPIDIDELIKKDFLRMIKKCYKSVEEDYINAEIETIKIKE